MSYIWTKQLSAYIMQSILFKQSAPPPPIVVAKILGMTWLTLIGWLGSCVCHFTNHITEKVNCQPGAMVTLAAQDSSGIAPS